MPKDLKSILQGVKTSTEEPLTLGKNPGVDYDPKAPDDRTFVSKHKVQKHEDRVGNSKDVYSGEKIKYSMDDKRMKSFGHKSDDDKKVYESIKKKV